MGVLLGLGFVVTLLPLLVHLLIGLGATLGLLVVFGLLLDLVLGLRRGTLALALTSRLTSTLTFALTFGFRCLLPLLLGSLLSGFFLPCSLCEGLLGVLALDLLEGDLVDDLLEGFLEAHASFNPLLKAIVDARGKFESLPVLHLLEHASFSAVLFESGQEELVVGLGEFRGDAFPQLLSG